MEDKDCKSEEEIRINRILSHLLGELSHTYCLEEEIGVVPPVLQSQTIRNTSTFSSSALL